LAIDARISAISGVMASLIVAVKSAQKHHWISSWMMDLISAVLLVLVGGVWGV